MFALSDLILLIRQYFARCPQFAAPSSLPPVRLMMPYGDNGEVGRVVRGASGEVVQTSGGHFDRYKFIAG